MERTAEEFLHQLRVVGEQNGRWFVGDIVNTIPSCGPVFMLTDGRMMTEMEIASASRQRQPRTYPTKRAAKRAAQAWLERAVDLVDRDRSVIARWDRTEALRALLDVVRLAFPAPNARGLPDVLAMSAIRNRLAAFKE